MTPLENILAPFLILQQLAGEIQTELSPQTAVHSPGGGISQALSMDLGEKAGRPRQHPKASFLAGNPACPSSVPLPRSLPRNTAGKLLEVSKFPHVEGLGDAPFPC